MLRRVALLGTLIFVLGTPRASEAGLLELIWEMTGPQMLGPSIGCIGSFSRPFKVNIEECGVGGATLTINEAAQPSSHGPFFALNGGYLFSTPKDSATQEYDWFDVHMFMIEPGIAFRSIGETSRARIRVYHGLGVTYNVLFGQHLKTFDKIGFTFTPIDFVYGDFGIALKMRLYPNGFTDDEFGFGPRQSFNRPHETTYGINFTWRFRVH